MPDFDPAGVPVRHAPRGWWRSSFGEEYSSGATFLIATTFPGNAGDPKLSAERSFHFRPDVVRQVAPIEFAHQLEIDRRYLCQKHDRAHQDRKVVGRQVFIECVARLPFTEQEK